MRQEQFEARFEARWEAFDAWLAWRHKSPLYRHKHAGPFPPVEAPPRYRELCQHLALARSRDYGPALVERLHRLTLEGHDILYGTSSGWMGAWFRWLAGGFARDVRAHWRSVLISSLLFYLPLIVIVIVVRRWPEFAHVVAPGGDLEEVARNFGPEQAARGIGTDVGMFGFYIQHNIGIGFRTFAGGIVAGLGSLYFLVFNGLIIGASEGHILNLGYAQRFHTFVIAHGSFELTAITLMGAAGLELGWALLSPGNLSRGAALRKAGQANISIVAGAAAMLLIAAGIEAFWSPRLLPPIIKYVVGAGCWVLVLAYFLFAGRRREA